MRRTTWPHAQLATLLVVLIFSIGTSAASNQAVLRDLDTVWGAVWDEYADPFFNGVDWHRIPDEVKPRIVNAESPEEAYTHLAEMVERLGDPATFLIEPEPYFSVMESEYAGVGILIGSALALSELAQEMEWQADAVAILEVFDGSPAESAGLLIGDVIVGVDDWDATGASIDDISARVRGEVGTPVEIALRDPSGEVRRVTITRGRVDLRPQTTFQRLDASIGYLRMDALLPTYVAQAKESLSANTDLDHLILDLRGVSSGDPTSLGEVASWFLGRVDLGAFESRYDRFALPAPDAAPIYSDGVSVLINGNTSGLAEVLALLLHEYDRAQLVGSSTAGGFSLTRVLRLPSGWHLSLSVARYESPRGRGIHADGLSPAVSFGSITLEQLRQERDPLLERTVEWVRQNQQG